jgi:hypothetical protein
MKLFPNISCNITNEDGDRTLRIEALMRYKHSSGKYFENIVMEQVNLSDNEEYYDYITRFYDKHLKLQNKIEIVGFNGRDENRISFDEDQRTESERLEDLFDRDPTMSID